MTPVLLMALALAGADAGLASASDGGPVAVTAPPADPGADPSVLREVYEGSKASLVQVGSDPLQAGVLIHESGLVVAPLAVARGTAEPAITFADGSKTISKLVSVDAALGIALLHVSLTEPAHGLALSEVPAAVGDPTYCLSFAAPQRPVITFARVATASVLRDKRIDERFFTSHLALPLDSIGGAVMDARGRMVGLVMANDATGTAFSISARALLRVIEVNELRLPTVALTVTTDPSGAEVLLDGHAQGHAPLTLPAVPAGLHTLILRAPGLPDTVREVVALGEAHQQTHVILFPGAEVDLRTTADASVYVDGILRARGTSRLWLPAGGHWISSRLEGFRPFGRWVEVVEGRAVQIDADLAETRATLSVTSDPPAAQAFLDDNFIGVTPLKQVKVAPGTYELSLELRGYHPTQVPAVIPDDADVDLGKVTLPPPRATLHYLVVSGTEVSIDNGPRHMASTLGETVPVGDHTVTFYAPYQYRAKLTFHAGDNQVVSLGPTFIPAGTETKREVVRTISTVVEGAAGITTLVTMAFFLLAEGDREGNGGATGGDGNGGGPSTSGILSSTGHSYLSTGLTLGAVSLGLFGAGELIGFAQPTPDMGFDEDPPKSP